MEDKKKNKSESWLDKLRISESDERGYAEDLAIVTGSQAIAQAMESVGLTRSALADKLGCHKSFVTRVLSGPQNMTLSTLGSFLWACGFEVSGIDVAHLGAQGFVEDVKKIEATIDQGIGQFVELRVPLVPLYGDKVGSLRDANNNLALAA